MPGKKTSEEEGAASPLLPEIKNEKKSYEIIKRVHRAVIYGDNLSPSELAWQGQVKLNKDVTIEEWYANKRQYRTLPGCKPIKIGIIQLQEIVRKAIQEGPEDMRINFFTTDGGKARVPNALSIEILDEELDPNYAAYLQNKDTLGIPKL